MAILSFEQEFTKRHPTRVSMLRFLREATEKKEVNWEDLTLSALEDARDLMVENLAANSAQVYCAILKSFLSKASEDVSLPTTKFNKVLKVKHEPTQNCCLTEEELMKFEEYVPKDQNEMDVKILFMRAALSGARVSDCKQMSEDNTRGGFLTYVSIKTKTQVVQPVHKRLEKYLEMQPSREMYGMTINRIIKRICKKTRIYGTCHSLPQWEDADKAEVRVDVDALKQKNLLHIFGYKGSSIRDNRETCRAHAILNDV